MRVAIIGGRKLWLSPVQIERAVALSGLQPTSLVCGCGNGVDKSVGHCQAPGNHWLTSDACAVQPGRGRRHGWACQMVVAVDGHYPADWAQFGRSAGPRRNAQLVDAAEAVLAIPDVDSVGTWDTVARAERRGLTVTIVSPKQLGGARAYDRSQSSQTTQV